MNRYGLRHTLLFLTLISVVLLGCSDDILRNADTTGNTTLTLKFDLLKYLDSSQKSIEYGQDPVIPGDLGSYEIQSPTQTIDLRSEMADVNSVESVVMKIVVAFHNQTGTADLTYSAYLAGVDEDPLQTPPIIAEHVSLSGHQDTTSEIDLVSDDRLLDLFNEGIMQYCAHVLFEIAQGSENVSGVAEVVQFDVTVETTL